MSLTSYLRNRDIKACFKENMPMPAPRYSKPRWSMVAPPVSPRPSLIGTAFDYILRFHLRRLNPLAQERKLWIAEEAVEERLLGRKMLQAGHDICTTARRRYRNFLDGAPLDDELLASAILLAQLDAVKRAIDRWQPDKLTAFPEDIADLRQLVDACDCQQWSALKLLRLNPSFGIGSSLMQGADADFQHGGTLYDIKTVRDYRLSPDHYHQLVGYMILNYLNGGPRIDELAIYYSRYGMTASWPAPNLDDARHEPFLFLFCATASTGFNTTRLLPELNVSPSLRLKLNQFRVEHKLQIAKKRNIQSNVNTAPQANFTNPLIHARC